MEIKEIAQYLEDEALVLEGLDDCILGYSHESTLIYSHAKMVDHFIEIEGMSEEEALEWIDFNVLGLLNNALGFVMCYEV